MKHCPLLFFFLSRSHLLLQIGKPEWKPDFGPAQFVPRWGATATGVRKFLIAFNINVLGTKEQAHRIALNLREQGRGPNEPGRLKAVQGIGDATSTFTRT